MGVVISKNKEFTHEQFLRFLKFIINNNKKIDFCDVQKHFSGTRYKKHESASDTILFFTDLVNVFKNYKVPMMIKMFLDTDSKYTGSLITEAKIYKYITEKIIIPKKSDCFVPYIGLVKCSDLLEDFKNMDINDKDEIYSRYSHLLKDEELLSEDLYLLMTERITNSTSFKEFLYSMDKSKDFSYSEKDLLKVIFLIIDALCIMQTYKIMHNDLHFGNILIKKLDKPKKFILSNGVSFYSKYQPYIFDWDRGLIEGVIKNPALDERRCKRSSGECPQFNKKRDIFTFSCSLYKFLEKNENFNKVKKYLSSHFDGSLIKLNERKGGYIDRDGKYVPPHKCRLVMRNPNSMEIITTLPNSEDHKPYYLDDPKRWMKNIIKFI